MVDIPATTFFNFFLYLFIPFLVAMIFKKTKLSPLIGYILGGIIIGNLFNNLFSRSIINNFAYFGIMLLTFTVGLEVQFERILILKKFIIIGGLLQMTITIFLIFILSLIFSFPFLQSFLLGLAFSSSSTTLVTKIIQDRGEESSFYGELALGMLMFQNIAFIPFMIIFTSFTSQTVSFFEILKKITIDLALSLMLLVTVYYLGKKVVPYIFDKVARNSRELLNIFIIIFIFFIGYLSSLFKVPILVSIFVAGVLIAQTSEHYHIFSQIRPLRDLLAIIFFVFIGSTVQLGLVGPVLPKIIIFALSLMFIKALVVAVVFLSFRFSSKLTFYLALFLSQIDEDAFILISVAFANNLFSKEDYAVIIGTILLTLIVTPLITNNKEKVYLVFRNAIRKLFPSLDLYIKHRIDSNRSSIDALDIKDHVVICGYGRVGSYIGRALMLSSVPFMAIDYNFHTVERAKKEGINIIYGDPTDFDILDYAEVENASAVVMAVPNRFAQEAFIHNVKKLNPNILIVSRVHQQKDNRRMRDLGVDYVVQPEFEASLSIIKKILVLKKLPREEIVKKLQYFKLEQGAI